MKKCPNNHVILDNRIGSQQLLYWKYTRSAIHSCIITLGFWVRVQESRFHSFTVDFKLRSCSRWNEWCEPHPSLCWCSITICCTSISQTITLLSSVSSTSSGMLTLTDSIMQPSIISSGSYMSLFISLCWYQYICNCLILVSLHAFMPPKAPHHDWHITTCNCGGVSQCLIWAKVPYENVIVNCAVHVVGEISNFLSVSFVCFADMLSQMECISTHFESSPPVFHQSMECLQVG